MEGYPDQCFRPVCEMSDRGEAYLRAHGGEEDVFVDKETINRQFNILLELDELLGNLDNTLRHALAIPSHRAFHLENRSTPNYICGLDVLGGYIRPRDPPHTYNCSEV